MRTVPVLAPWGGRRAWPRAAIAGGLLLLLLAAVPAAAQPTTLVGVLTRQAHRQCTPTGSAWVHPYLAIGFVELVDPPAGAAQLVGKMVRAVGVPVASPPRPAIQHTGPCLPEQLRSDMVPGPTVMRYRRSHNVPLAGFRPKTVAAVSPLRVRRTGDALDIRFDPRTVGALGTVRIAVYYEGCFGKPSQQTRSWELLGARARRPIRRRAPATLGPTSEPRDTRPYRAVFVHVTGSGDGVAVDLDASLGRQLSVPVACPKSR